MEHVLKQLQAELERLNEAEAHAKALLVGARAKRRAAQKALAVLSGSSGEEHRSLSRAEVRDKGIGLLRQHGPLTKEELTQLLTAEFQKQKLSTTGLGLHLAAVLKPLSPPDANGRFALKESERE